MYVILKLTWLKIVLSKCKTQVETNTHILRGFLENTKKEKSLKEIDTYVLVHY